MALAVPLVGVHGAWPELRLAFGTEALLPTQASAGETERMGMDVLVRLVTVRVGVQGMMGRGVQVADNGSEGFPESSDAPRGDAAGLAVVSARGVVGLQAPAAAVAEVPPRPAKKLRRRGTQCEGDVVQAPRRPASGLPFLEEGAAAGPEHPASSGAMAQFSPLQMAFPSLEE